MKVIGSRNRYFENGDALSALLGGEPAGDQVLTAAVCAHAWAVVCTLRPTDFAFTEGEGAQACDIYHLGLSWPARLFAAAEQSGTGRLWMPECGLRIALQPYPFDDQGQLLYIVISALPETF